MKSNRTRFLFLLIMLMCGTIVNAQTSNSNKEKAYQKFKKEIEERKKHREEMLMKARASQNNAAASAGANKPGQNNSNTSQPATYPMQSGSNSKTEPGLKSQRSGTFNKL